MEDLEKGLRVRPGSLVREVDHWAEEGGDWTEHLPYGFAAEYYESPKTQAQFRAHVDECSYCQRLLETLHPSDVDARDFARVAASAQPKRGSRFGKLAIGSAAATGGVLMFFVAVLAIPTLQRKGWISLTSRETPAIAHALRAQPNALGLLESSDVPEDRWLAASYYFAADKPQLAWQQVGQGLQLAGVGTSEARKITTAADVPSDKPAQSLVDAARRLRVLEASASSKDPTIYLQRAEAQAKLGLNDEALKSIREYLKASNVDPKTLADFSETARAEPSRMLLGATVPSQ